MILGFADGITSILWRNGKLIAVVPEQGIAAVERALSQPVDVWQSVVRMGEDGAPQAIEERVEQLAPGTPEHAARAILSLPGGTLLVGDEFIPDDDEESGAESA